ncbi:MAG: Ni/Fe hydrogenase subunit alpha [Fervidicoccaceae archaeon]
MSSRKIVIDPITRLEGHGKIAIILDDEGNCLRAYFQVPELRGFEKFLQGRHAEDAPIITPRICGVCPTAHHTASVKALDDLYKAPPPSPALKIREMFYNLFMLEDHALHFYVLSGPDFIVGPDAPRAERNIVGVMNKVGKELVLRIITIRKRIRKMMEIIGGRTIHPVFGMPGGISRPLSIEQVKEIRALADEALSLSLITLEMFKKIVLGNKSYLQLIESEAYTHRTYYMGMVDGKNRVNFYDGLIRVIDPKGREIAKFHPSKYLEHISERVEPWTYVTFTYLRKVGWKGFIDGENSGIYSVAPLARLNASEGMATPIAQEAFEEMYESLGGRPVHYTLANHWARVIEMIYAAERVKELSEDPEIESKDIRNTNFSEPSVGIGAVEAPRGTLIHHYETDENGVIKRANLLVATQHNAARISLSIDKAARSLIRKGEISDGLLNMVEMAFRAYDPCLACATHEYGSMPLSFYLYDQRGNLKKILHPNG